MKPYILSASTIKDQIVLNKKGEIIGKIIDLMINQNSGEVLYAILSFDNLPVSRGMYYPIPIQVLSFSAEDKWALIEADEDTLKEAPGFDMNSWPMYPTAEFVASVYDHFGMIIADRGPGFRLAKN